MIDLQKFFQSIGDTAYNIGQIQHEKKKEQEIARAGQVFRMASQQPGMTREDFLSLVGRQEKPSFEFSRAMEHYASRFPTRQQWDTRQAIEANRMYGQQKEMQREQRVRQGSLRTVSSDISKQVIADIMQNSNPKVDPITQEADYGEAVVQRLGVIGGDIVEAAKRYGYDLSENEISAVKKNIEANVVNKFQSPNDPYRQLARVIAAGNRETSRQSKEIKREIDLVKQGARSRDAAQEFTSSLGDFSGLSEAYDLETGNGTGKLPEAKYPIYTKGVDKKGKLGVIYSQYEKYGREVVGKLNKTMDEVKKLDVLRGSETRMFGPDDFPRELDQVVATLSPYVVSRITPGGSKREAMGFVNLHDPDKVKRRIRQIVVGVLPIQQNMLDYVVDKILAQFGQ